MLKTRPGHATVVAYTALFASLGGGAYAATQLPAGSVGTRQLKDGAVATRKIANRAVTRSKIDVGTLGTLPRAAHAGRAASAGNADKLGGRPPSSFAPASSVGRLDFTSNGNPEQAGQSDTRPVLTVGALTLTATCSFNGADFLLTATSAGSEAGIDAGYVTDTTPGTAGSPVSSNPSKPTPVLTVSGSNAEHRVVGTIVYRDTAETVTIPFRLYYHDTGAETDCLLAGTATRATP